jgi:hypothetical protein
LTFEKVTGSWLSGLGRWHTNDFSNWVMGSFMELEIVPKWPIKIESILRKDIDVAISVRWIEKMKEPREEFRLLGVCRKSGLDRTGCFEKDHVVNLPVPASPTVGHFEVELEKRVKSRDQKFSEKIENSIFSSMKTQEMAMKKPLRFIRNKVDGQYHSNKRQSASIQVASA